MLSCRFMGVSPHIIHPAIVTLKRAEVVEAMARAAWDSTGEPPYWETMPIWVQDEWLGYQKAALSALELCAPELTLLFSE